MNFGDFFQMSLSILIDVAFPIPAEIAQASSHLSLHFRD